MVFNSLEFGFFLLAVLAVYPLLARRGQNAMLLVASYVFYGAWDWRFLSLIAASTLVDFAVGLRLAGTFEAARRRRLLAVSVVTNLGILALFKYAGFFVESFADLLRAVGLTAEMRVWEAVLPVGISFYTFQTLSYTIDVYRRRLEPTRDLLDFALFVAFFPQLVAGPIERASRLLPQIERPRRVGLDAVRSGVTLGLWGLFKKVVIADNLAPMVEAVYAPAASPSAPEVLLATYTFAVQIYCDFSGYTDIARGVARVLGFELMVNFRLPYFARNPSEFWRRWHISLSTWLRDYLYIPLGGNRGGRLETYRNLLLTMVLGGLWHGAAWTFVIWGAIHGGWLAAHRALRGPLARLQPRSAVARAVGHALAVVVTFHVVCLAWVFFRAESLARALELLATFSGTWSWGVPSGWWVPLVVLVAPLIAIQVLQWTFDDLEAVRRLAAPLRAGIYVGLVAGIVILGEDFGQPFIYFQF